MYLIQLIKKMFEFYFRVVSCENGNVTCYIMFLVFFAKNETGGGFMIIYMAKIMEPPES